MTGSAMERIEAILGFHPWLATALWVVALAVSAALVGFIVNGALARFLNPMIAGISFIKGKDVADSGIVARLADAAPAIVISNWITAVPGLHPALAQMVRNVADAVTILFVAMAAVAGLRLAGRLWQNRHADSGHSIKGYVQIAAIVVYAMATVLMVAVVINRSPLLLLSGLGALTAVLILVFQDTLLSLVASVQLSSTDIVKVGDWIEMPSMDANGNVIDLSLYSVTVRNWDNTYSTFPVRKLVSDPFKNWRGMTEAGARRIMRSIPIDQSTVRFLVDADVERLSHLRRITDFVANEAREIADWNAKLGAPADIPANRRRMTNLGLFRAYMESYLADHPGIRQDMMTMVRYLSPGPYGMPLEVYCFTGTTDWKAYEAIQSDIFDHLTAMLPEFGLSVFQST